jgi:NAD(P)-dependent dehydrogenase (short-subunit alcohol dehydrogenase family)
MARRATMRGIDSLLREADMDYRNKVVFVAGGTSGINLGIAEGFAAAGARVIVASRKQDKVDAAVARLSRDGGLASGYALDVRNFDAVAAAFADVAEKFGAVDVLVSGAAGNFLAPAAEMSANAFKTVVDIDLLGTFNVMRAAWPHLRKPGAAVVSITAGQSWLAMQNQVHVCAAKAGVDQVTRTLALEWGPSGVRINSIAPGPIAATEGMARLAPTDASVAAWTAAVPLRRFGTPDDIAKAVMWICSEDAAYINGVVLPVDGGLTLNGSFAITSAMAAS